MKNSSRSSIALMVFVAVSVHLAWYALTSLSTAVAGPGGPPPAQSGLEQISHQGVVSVNGQRLTGTGHFRFAIVDPDTNLNRWTNDGTQIGASAMPTGAVSLPVTNGVYSVRLGSSPMAALNSYTFLDSNLQLRVWFSDGTNPVQLLSPDQTLTSAAYAMNALGGPPLGSIIAWHQHPNPNNPTASIAAAPPSNWMLCNGDALPPDSPLRATGATNTPDLNNTPFPHNSKGRFLRGSPHSGDFEDDELKLHTHGVNDPGHSHNFNMGAREFGDTNAPSTGCFPHHNYLTFTHTATTGISVQASGGNETRPTSMSVVWIIRVK